MRESGLMESITVREHYSLLTEKLYQEYLETESLLVEVERFKVKVHIILISDEFTIINQNKFISNILF